MQPIDIPETTPDRYISGMSALNIPAPEDTGGDWHFHRHFFETSEGKPTVMLAGEGQEIDTNAIYGRYGIHECSEFLRARRLVIAPGQKVYSANHFRAILDMVYDYLALAHKYPYSIQIDEWLDREEDEAFLLQKAAEMKTVLTPEDAETLAKWIEKQKEPGYYA